MTWHATEPKCGDIIRIELSPGLYHYGIYVSDDEVIAFGLPPIGGFTVPSSEIKVISTAIDKFYCGKFLEVASLSFAEKLKAKKRGAVVAFARSRIGDGGYHIAKNNCEHFVYECVFGVKKSSQSDSAAEVIKSMSAAFVYLAEISDDVATDNQLYPLERMQEINSCANDKVKRQKYAVWKLLGFALNDALSVDIEKTNIHKQSSGKWVCSDCYFSLSHTDGVCVVAVSKEPVGVDIELSNRRINRAAVEKAMNKAESKYYSEHDSTLDMIKLWTKKESEFKRIDEDVFKPVKINTLEKHIKTYSVDKFGALLSVSFDGGKTEFFEVTDNLSGRNRIDLAVL